jgi:DNA-binding NtrC family response regulator
MTILPEYDGTQPYAGEVFKGDSPAVTRLRTQVARIAPHFRIALLAGEPGTGKHTIAQRLHHGSRGAAHPFHAFPASDFADRIPAHHPAGTIYLRGLQSLNSAAQTALLASLRSLHRDTRIILSSEGDLKGMVAAGRMHPDLYNFVGMLEIRVPPLRERTDDLPLLAAAMLRHASKDSFFTPSALARLTRYGWPGNLHELHRRCQNLPASGPLEASNLHWLDDPTPNPAPPLRLDEVIHRHVKDVLENCSGNKLKAADLLGISRSTLYRMLQL